MKYKVYVLKWLIKLSTKIKTTITELEAAQSKSDELEMLNTLLHSVKSDLVRITQSDSTGDIKVIAYEAITKLNTLK